MFATLLRCMPPRDTVSERAASERRIAETVAEARQAGVSWAAIGGMLGTSGEAARKRYTGQPAKTAYRPAPGHMAIHIRTEPPV